MKKTGFVRTRDLVERYGVVSNTLNRWRQRREFPNPVFAGHGADNFYDVEEVIAWEEKQRAERDAA